MSICISLWNGLIDYRSKTLKILSIYDTNTYVIWQTKINTRIFTDQYERFLGNSSFFFLSEFCIESLLVLQMKKNNFISIQGRRRDIISLGKLVNSNIFVGNINIYELYLSKVKLYNGSIKDHGLISLCAAYFWSIFTLKKSVVFRTPT